MTSRGRFFNSTLVSTLGVGVLAAAGILIWSLGGPEKSSQGEGAIPDRPHLEAIRLKAEVPTDEPLPRIQVPALRPQPAPEPGRTGAEIVVPPRPRLSLVIRDVPRHRDELPGIRVPELRRPLGPPACVARA